LGCVRREARENFPVNRRVKEEEPRLVKGERIREGAGEEKVAHLRFALFGGGGGEWEEGDEGPARVRKS